MEFIKYFTSQEVNARFCRDSLFISPLLDNAQLDYSLEPRLFEIFSRALAVSPQLGRIRLGPIPSRELATTSGEIIVGGSQHELTPVAVEKWRGLAIAISLRSTWN